VHEFPEVQAMVREAVAQAPAGFRIKRLKIVVGEASGHSPRHIQEHFLEASRGTRAEGAALEFITEKLAAVCAACGAHFDSASLALACTHCGGRELAITAGKGVRLAGIEV
jgi:Zn finger protein HypA/HybF involved in hydrogenase expression